MAQVGDVFPHLLQLRKVVPREQDNITVNLKRDPHKILVVFCWLTKKKEKVLLQLADLNLFLDKGTTSIQKNVQVCTIGFDQEFHHCKGMLDKTYAHSSKVEHYWIAQSPTKDELDITDFPTYFLTDFDGVIWKRGHVSIDKIEYLCKEIVH